MHTFLLSENFISKYKRKRPPFGFNGLGELVYMRSYSRIKENGQNEKWWETVRRVVEGTYTMQMNWIYSRHLPWNPWKAQKSAQEMYDRMYNMKFLPPGRGLWAMGTKIITEKKLYAALNNCAFVSTKNLKDDPVRPFVFLMDASMLGVGVGFDTKGADSFIIKGINKNRSSEIYAVPDTREGWVESIKLLLESYFFGTGKVEFDYSLIRKKGLPLKTFGGISSGYKPLKIAHEHISQLLNEHSGEPISSSIIVDIMNLLGKCVVSGGVRRTAEISFGYYTDEDYLNLKNYNLNPHRKHYGWTSNNSIFADIGMDYSIISDRIVDNGEPGLIWLENMRAYSRMKNGKDNKDYRVEGANPCIVGNTLVAVADGRNAVPIKELVGTQYPVYSIDKNGKVVIKQSIKTWKTKENAEIWKLTLDDGSYLLATPDHLVMLRNKKYKKLNELNKNDSIMPFNSYISNNRYRQISSNIGRDRRQYRMIAENNNIIVDAKNTHIHHSDFNSFNDVITNLFVMPASEHIKLHSIRMFGNSNPMRNPKIVKKVLKTRKLNKTSVGQNNPMFGKKHSNKTRKIIGEKSKENWKNQREFMIAAIRHGITKDVRQKMSLIRKKKTIWVDWKCPVCGIIKTITKSQAERKKTCSHSCSNIKRSLENRGLWNHKVVSVEFYGYDDVYDMTVEDTNNFGVITSAQDDKFITSSGIFIHNCSEQSLESYEMCCLVETFPYKHNNLEDYLRTLKYAYLYAKTVTLGETHWAETNAIMLRNRRIGCSVSGVAQFITKHGLDTLKIWLNKGYEELERYDVLYSDWMAIRESKKKTSVKPSGTVSLLAGATPGVHYPESLYYIRRMELPTTSKLIEPLREAGYKLEPKIDNEDSSIIVEIPIKIEENMRTAKDLSIWEQFSLAAFMQQHWADNQVSCTITFDPDKERDQIVPALNYFQYKLKGISLLPRHDYGAYKQMPYEAITKEKYEKLITNIKKASFSKIEGEEAEPEKFCNNDFCEIILDK